MYDVEMMEMLNLIHAENRMIFELVKANMVINEEGRKEITFDACEKEYKRIMKNLEKYSLCVDCSYKNRFEKMKELTKDE